MRLVTGERDMTVELVAHLAELETRRLYLRDGFSSLYVYCREVLHLSEDAAYNRMAAAKAARAFPVILEMLGKEVQSSPSPVSTFAAQLVQAVVASADRRSRIAPRAPDRFAFSFTGKEAMRDRYLCARDLLRHAIPDGDMAEIFDRALIALLEDVARKRFAKTDRPRRSRGSAPGSRPIPARVKRIVFVRDLASCAFSGKGGRRCGERAFIEFHHLDPYAVGGEPTVERVELRCRAHNAYEAEVFYGHARGAKGRCGSRSPGTAI